MLPALPPAVRLCPWSDPCWNCESFLIFLLFSMCDIAVSLYINCIFTLFILLWESIHVDDRRERKAFIRVCLCVCLLVFVRSITEERMIQKSQTCYSEWSWYVLQVIWFLSQKVKGQGHSVTKFKNILKVIEWPPWVCTSVECPLPTV